MPELATSVGHEHAAAELGQLLADTLSQCHVGYAEAITGVTLPMNNLARLMLHTGCTLGAHYLSILSASQGTEAVKQSLQYVSGQVPDIKVQTAPLQM